MANQKKIELSLDDIRMALNIEDGEEEGGWDETLSFRDDGIYLREVEGASMTLIPTEINALYGLNPTFRTPLLSFPCSLEDLERFIQRQGLWGTIDTFALVEAVIALLDGPARSKQYRRERAIIEEIEAMGHDPSALPKIHGPKTPGIKAAVKQAMKGSRVFFGRDEFSEKAFNKVWEDLLETRQISYTKN